MNPGAATAADKWSVAALLLGLVVIAAEIRAGWWRA